jgi:hypothetical protein
LGSVAAGQAALVKAQPASAALAHLEWDRPIGSTCIGQDALAQKVEALLGRAVFVAAARADLQIVGAVQQVKGGWVATLRIAARGLGIQGVRQLWQEGPDCAALNSALTVVLSTLIDLAQPESRSEGVPIAVGIAGVFGLGVLPDQAAGGSLLFGAMPSAEWSVWIVASAWLPAAQLDGMQRGGVFEAWQVGLSLCREAHASELLGFSACAGGQLGVIDGEGRGLGPNRGTERLLAQTDLEGVASLRLSSVVAVRASTSGVLALSRPTFFVEQSDGSRSEVFRPPLFGLQLRLGVMFAIR